MPSDRRSRTLGVVGTGVIGTGWAARALAHGWDVVATDVRPDFEQHLRAGIARAWPAMEDLGLMPGANPDRLHCLGSIEEVGEVADVVQESVLEDLDLKRQIHAAIDTSTPAETLVASSSSGLLPSDIQQASEHPERLLIGHPFNPVYLLPLVEIVPGKKTAQVTVDRAEKVYRSLGMKPLRVRHEIEGYLSDRLQEAMWREALHLINEGVATTAELDDAIIYGPGLRWAAMGPNLTFHLAGGAGGMRQMLEQFGPALQLPWTKLVGPELTEELIEAMVQGTAEQAEGRSIDELEQLRDRYLIEVMRALRPLGIGAGRLLQEREEKIRQAEQGLLFQPDD